MAQSDDDTFVVVSALDGCVDIDECANGSKSQLMNAQNQQNAQTPGGRVVTIGARGTIIEMPNLENETPGPDGFTFHRDRRTTSLVPGNRAHGLRTGTTGSGFRSKILRHNRYRFYKTRWNSGRHGNPYAHYYPVGTRPNKYRGGPGVGFHGVRFPTVKLSSLGSKTHRDENDDKVTDHLINSERSNEPLDGDDGTDDGAIAGHEGDVDTFEPTDNVASGSKRRTRIVEKRPTLVIIANNDLDDESGDEAPVRRPKPTCHIQKKRSSAAKMRIMSQNDSVVDSEPDLNSEPTPTPVVVRLKPAPNRTLIEKVYGFGLNIHRDASKIH